MRSSLNTNSIIIPHLCYIYHIFTNIIFLSLQYNIKKKEETVEAQPQEPDNPLMRRKKTPEELAKEAEEADLDELTSKNRIL